MMTTTEAGACPLALVSFPRAPATLCRWAGDHTSQAQPCHLLYSRFLQSDLHHAKKTPLHATEILLGVPLEQHVRAKICPPPMFSSPTLRKAPSPQPTVSIQSQEVVYLHSVLTSGKACFPAVHRRDHGVTGPGRLHGGWGPAGVGGTWGL